MQEEDEAGSGRGRTPGRFRQGGAKVNLPPPARLLPTGALPTERPIGHVLEPGRSPFKHIFVNIIRTYAHPPTLVFPLEMYGTETRPRT